MDRVNKLHFLHLLQVLLGKKCAIHIYVRLTVLKRMDANVDAKRSSRSSKSQIATLVATDIHRVAEAVAPIACPQTYILRRNGAKLRIGVVFFWSRSWCPPS